MDFLSRDPFQNVFLIWLIQRRPFPIGDSLCVYRTKRGQIEGVIFYGRHLVLAAAGDTAVDAFANAAPRSGFERMMVGPRPIVERYWECVRQTHAPPRLVRASQPVMAVDRASLKGELKDVTVRPAHSDEWKTVAAGSAQMIRQELEYDPRAQSPDFDAGIRTAIERGTWWVGKIAGKLCFFCNAGPSSDQTLQLQGIWTPPKFRRRGLGTSALYGICTILLKEFPTLSLYVNDFNTPAIALYERLGFRRVGEFSTILF